MTMRVGFVMEQSLGHTTHAQNLKQALRNHGDVTPYWVELPFAPQTAWQKLPGIRANWSLRASMAAALALRSQRGTLDAALFHTQVTSLFSTRFMRQVPSVISLDATPVQYDAMGAYYGHTPSSNTRLEAFKRGLNVRAFGAAKRLVAWSQWAAHSLMADYNVPSEKIVVIPPGIDTAQWYVPRRPRLPDCPLNLLFVGGDWERKGGTTLLNALERLPARTKVQVHVVSKAAQAAQGIAGVTVHDNLGPNSDGLRQLFACADAFVFPTHADCLALAVIEAMAAGLPIITTSVGALPEFVTHGETGLVVKPGDADALAQAVTALADDEGLRTCLSQNARRTALERFDSATNYRLLLETVCGVATPARQTDAK